MRERTDHSLLLATARGDEAAFAELVARHRPRLVRYAASRCGRDVGLAEDAVQDGLVRAHRAIVGGKVPVDVEAWLFAIVRNRCHDYFRAAKPTAPLPPELPGGAPSAFEVVEQGERLAGALDAVERLPRAQRTALVGRELEGRSYEELAHRQATTVRGGQVPAAPRAGHAGPPGLAAGVRHAPRGPPGAGAPRPDRDGHGRRARDRRRGHRDHRAGRHERARLAARARAARRADLRAVAGRARRGGAPAAPDTAARAREARARGVQHAGRGVLALPARRAVLRRGAARRRRRRRGGGEYGP